MSLVLRSKCERCCGTGTRLYEAETCSLCEGTGYANVGYVEDLESTLNDIDDKLDDIMDKLDDID